MSSKLDFIQSFGCDLNTIVVAMFKLKSLILYHNSVGISISYGSS